MLNEMRICNCGECTVTIYITSLLQLSKYLEISPNKISGEQEKSFAYHLIHSKQVLTSIMNQLICTWKFFQVDVLGIYGKVCN